MTPPAGEGGGGGLWHKVSKTHVTLINLAHFAFVVVFLMRFANEASERAREQHWDWWMGAMTMMMTPRLATLHSRWIRYYCCTRSWTWTCSGSTASFRTCCARPSPYLPPSPLCVLICVSRFCILIALSYSQQHQPPLPSSPLDGATCAIWPPACNSSDNFSLANPLCCTCLRLSCRESLCVCVPVLNSHSNWLVHNPEILWIKPAHIHLHIPTHTGAHTSA